jgi:hypothetical protein
MATGFFLLCESFGKAAFEVRSGSRKGDAPFCCNGVMATRRLKWSGRKAGLELT